jgi:hypothetical protein
MKDPTLRVYKLMINGDRFPLTICVITVKGNINITLNMTLIQAVDNNAADNLLFTTMDMLKAISLISKFS